MKKLLEEVQSLRASLNRLYLDDNEITSERTKNITTGKILALTAVETYILEDMQSQMDHDIHQHTDLEIIDD